MKKLLLIFWLAIAVVFFACESDNYDVDRSIWIADPNDSNLPQYSESGYNTFGAQINGDYFTSGAYTNTPCYFVWNDTTKSLKMVLNGYNSSYRYYRYDDNCDMSLTITIPCDATINCIDNLYLLDGKSFDLSDTQIKVEIKRGDNPAETIPNIRSGKFTFKRVQMMYIDDEFYEAIVSGTFDFHYFDGTPCNISKGRFDLGINENLFW